MSKMSHGKDKKNFGIYTAEEFIETRQRHTPCLIAGGQYLRWFASLMMMDGPVMKSPVLM